MIGYNRKRWLAVANTGVNYQINNVNSFVPKTWNIHFFFFVVLDNKNNNLDGDFTFTILSFFLSFLLFLPLLFSHLVICCWTNLETQKIKFNDKYFRGNHDEKPLKIFLGANIRKIKYSTKLILHTILIL